MPIKIAAAQRQLSPLHSLDEPQQRWYWLVDQPTEWAVQDRRQQIIEAGLTTLREHGYPGFTQPRVAAVAGLRQSHLTYYYPTRLDLLAAVGRAAVDRQLAATEAMLAVQSLPETAAQALAEVISRHQNTRVFLALAQVGDEEPRLRDLFHELADGLVARLGAFLGRLGEPSTPTTEEPARLLHALLVGLAVVHLATGWPDGTQRAAGILETALHLILGGKKPSKRPSRGAQAARQQGKGQ